jgi:hypothetical protein
MSDFSHAHRLARFYRAVVVTRAKVPYDVTEAERLAGFVRMLAVESWGKSL